MQLKYRILKQSKRHKILLKIKSMLIRFIYFLLCPSKSLYSQLCYNKDYQQNTHFTFNLHLLITRTPPPHGYKVFVQSGKQATRQPAPSPRWPPLNAGCHVPCYLPAFSHSCLLCPLLRNRTFSFFITFSVILHLQYFLRRVHRHLILGVPLAGARLSGLLRSFPTLGRPTLTSPQKPASVNVLVASCANSLSALPPQDRAPDTQRHAPRTKKEISLCSFLFFSRPPDNSRPRTAQQPNTKNSPVLFLAVYVNG